MYIFFAFFSNIFFGKKGFLRNIEEIAFSIS